MSQFVIGIAGHAIEISRNHISRRTNGIAVHTIGIFSHSIGMARDMADILCLPHPIRQLPTRRRQGREFNAKAQRSNDVRHKNSLRLRVLASLR